MTVPRYAGELAAVGTAVCWSIGSNFFAAAGQRMGSRVLNRLRVTTACVLLSLALFATRGAWWPVWASRPQIGWLAASGIIGFVFGDGWYFRSLVILGPGRAALIASSAPIFTLVFAALALHERPGPLALLGTALTLGGIAWVLRERERGHEAHVEGSVAMGVFAGILGAVGQAGGYVLSKTALRTGIDPMSATLIRLSAAAVAVWLLTAVQRQVRETLGVLRDRRAAAFMLAGSTFGSFLGVTLSLTAIQFIDTGVAASITAIYPVFAMFLASRFHGERLTLRALLGACVAVAGVIVLFLR
jgi:uncharacterized membrane protein